MENKKKAIEKIVVKYNDGTEREIDKGAVVNMTPHEDETTLNFEFTDLNGEDLATLVYGVTEIGMKMGLFDEE